MSEFATPTKHNNTIMNPSANFRRPALPPPALAYGLPVSGAPLMFRRARFAEVTESQLAVVAHDHTDVIDEVKDRLDAYNRAGRDDAEDLYGDYVDAVETGTEILADVRDHYARSVEDPDRYCIEFNRAVARRMPAFALEIENR